MRDPRRWATAVVLGTAMWVPLVARGAEPGRAAGRHLLPVALAAALATGPAAARAEERPVAQHVEAALAYRVLEFVEWPGSAAIHESPSVELCVLGDEGFARAASASLAGRSLGGRRLRVQAVQDVAACKPCHVVFVGGDGEDGVDRAAVLLGGAGIITFARGPRSGGALFTFYTEDEKVRFEVDLDAARRARVKVSSKLLSLAGLLGKGEL